MTTKNAVDHDFDEVSLDHTTLPSRTGQSADAVPLTTPLLGPGDWVGDWVVEGHLGTGSLSQVYAVTGMLGGVPRRLALKLIHAPGEPALGESILREAYALTSFSHPSLIQALAVWQAETDGPLNGAVAVLLPLAEFSLAEYLRRFSGVSRWRMTEQAVCSGAAEIAGALAYLHKSGKPDGSAVVVHNDVKPDNVRHDRPDTRRFADADPVHGAR